jgi:hypothetical protein
VVAANSFLPNRGPLFSLRIAFAITPGSVDLRDSFRLALGASSVQNCFANHDRQRAIKMAVWCATLLL